LQLTVEKLVYGGDGLARLPADEHGRGKALFLPFVLDGENVEASVSEQKPGFARGVADQILTASPHRVPPPCPYFAACGGCHYQHSSYEHQLEIKTAILKENLRRIAKLELDREPSVHASPPWNYRNRTRFKIRTQPEFALGYYRFNSHQLLSVEQCPISSPLINHAILALTQMGRTGPVPDGLQEIEFSSNAEDTQLLIELFFDLAVDLRLATETAQRVKSAVTEAIGVVASKSSGPGKSEPITTIGDDSLRYIVRSASFRASAGSFFQVNRHLTDELVRIVTEDCSGKMAFDLYAGVGLFSAALARSFAQVFAVESSPTSHADLIYNSQANVRAVRSTTDQFLKNRVRKLRPDLVVLDPPRSGLGEVVVRSLGELGARQVTYVSCDPATLSRDLAGLLKAGYRVQQAHVVDLFPQTYHIESVFRLSL
jgi:23S rRNA (uracil1939-C5)-methyltransferase